MNTQPVRQVIPVTTQIIPVTTQMTPPEINHPLVRLWRNTMCARSLSKRTVNERVATLVRFATWCNIDPVWAETEHISDYLTHGGEWSAETRWTYHTSLNAWFTWLQRFGHRTDNPMHIIDRPRRAKSEPHPLSDGELIRLLNTRMHRRTRAMITTAAFAGLRAHEVAKLRGEHFDLVAQTMIVKGKGNSTKNLPVHSRIIDIAKEMPRQGFWFPGTDAGHQHRQSVCAAIKQAMVRAGIHASAHALRHWFCTHLVEKGVDMGTVSSLARHESVATTQIYVKMSERKRFSGIELLDPFTPAF